MSEGDLVDLQISDGIDVSNACRRFYVSRLQAAETLKERLSKPRDENVDVTTSSTSGNYSEVGRNNRTFQAAMAQLRSELASLIDVDLEVMRQLLMLNDQVEELKWQRRRQSIASSATISTPSYDLADIDDDRCTWSRLNNRPWSCEVSTLDRSPMTLYGRESILGLSKYPTPSTLSLLRSSSQDCCSSMEDILDEPSVADSPNVFDGGISYTLASVKLTNNNNNNVINVDGVERSGIDEKSVTSDAVTTSIGGTDENNAAEKAAAAMPSVTLRRSPDAKVKFSTQNPRKERPEVKPKPKSALTIIKASGGDLKSIVTKPAVDAETSQQIIGGFSFSNNNSNNCNSSRTAPSDHAPSHGFETKNEDEDVIGNRKLVIGSRLAASDRNSDIKVVKGVKGGKDLTSVHSAGTDSFHELSTFVEMLI